MLYKKRNGWCSGWWWSTWFLVKGVHEWMYFRYVCCMYICVKMVHGKIEKKNKDLVNLCVLSSDSLLSVYTKNKEQSAPRIHKLPQLCSTLQLDCLLFLLPGYRGYLNIFMILF